MLPEHLPGQGLDFRRDLDHLYFIGGMDAIIQLDSQSPK